MKKSPPKQNATISKDLVPFRPACTVGTERINGRYYAMTKSEDTVIRRQLSMGFTRKVRAKMRKHSREPVTVIKSLNTYSVDKEVGRLNRLFQNYTRKQFPLTRSERKKAALALVRYSKDELVYMTIKQATALICLYETMLDGVNYFVNEGVERLYYTYPHRCTEKYFTGHMYKQPMWVYSTVRAIFNMLHSIHEDGMTLDDQIEEIQDRLDRLYREEL